MEVAFVRYSVCQLAARYGTSAASRGFDEALKRHVGCIIVVAYARDNFSGKFFNAVGREMEMKFKQPARKTRRAVRE